MTEKKLPPEFGNMPSGTHMGFDMDGSPLPMSSRDVQRRVLSALDDPGSEMILAILRHRGELVVQVMGEPSQDVLDMLTQARDSYARILKGQ